MNHCDDFIQFVKDKIPEEELSSVTTNRGIHISMLLSPYRGSDSFFQAHLPCRGPSQRVVTIDLALWRSNYYRRFGTPGSPLKKDLQFRQASYNATFEINDSAFTENKFTATEATDTLTLTATNTYRIRRCYEKQGNGHFAVIFGQCFGQDWIRLVNNPPTQFLPSYIENLMMIEEPDRMVDMPPRSDCRGHIWVYHMCLPGST